MSAVLEPEVVNSIPSSVQRVLNPNLTTKQSLFVQYFIETRNGVKSAQLAGYKGNYDTLRQVAAENLAKPCIKQAIEDHFSALHISSSELLAEIASVARIPLEKDVLEASGVKVSDKIKAAELAGKYLGLWDKASESPSIDLSELVQLIGVGIERMREQRQLEAISTTETTP